MMRLTGLGRKIAVRMAVVTLVGLAASALSSFALYSWVFENAPGAVAPPGAWVPQAIDYFAFAVSGALAIGIAVVAGVQLARRIVLPLTSLAQAARRIAQGDLSARAAAGDRSLGETAELVDDFNAMAGRLDSLASNLVIWNAAIAHELRTPVTILKGRLQGVSDGLFEMDDALLESLLKQVDGLARLVEDLRVVSLADSGHLHLQNEPVDTAVVIGDLKDVVEPGLAAAGFDVVWALQSAPINADATRLRQAALALIENVRRHATPGNLWIRTSAAGGSVRITVEDCGPGLSPGFANAAFDPFRRDSYVEGSGLGLTVVRVIAEAHGGQALYRPRPEGGSVFEITLPVS